LGFPAVDSTIDESHQSDLQMSNDEQGLTALHDLNIKSRLVARFLQVEVHSMLSIGEFAEQLKSVQGHGPDSAEIQTLTVDGFQIAELRLLKITRSRGNALELDVRLKLPASSTRTLSSDSAPQHWTVCHKHWKLDWCLFTWLSLPYLQ
jgi:hypothetical protein